jgi:hypothetical protein
MNASFEVKEYYLHIKVIGQFTASSASEIFRKWIEEVKKRKLSKVLFDLTQAAGFGSPEQTNKNRFDAGELIALFIPKNVTLAILGRPNQAERDRWIENLFRTRGIRVKVTQSLEEALKWLKIK